MKLQLGAVHTPAEVARMFDVDESTVRRWFDAGRLYGFKTPGGHRRITDESLREFLRRGYVPRNTGTAWGKDRSRPVTFQTHGQPGNR